MQPGIKRIIGFFILFLFWGYTPFIWIFPGDAAAAMEKIDAGGWPVFDDDADFADLADAVSASIGYFERFDGEKTFLYGGDRYSAKILAQGLRRFLAFLETEPASRELSAFIRENGSVYAHRENGRQVTVLFTGYFEPEVSGRTDPCDQFRYPVYARPDDLVTVNLSAFGLKVDQNTIVGRHAGREVVPYFSRSEIEAGAIHESAEVIAWVDDPVALFFLHIQGSGRIVFENGRQINVHYDASNGRPYKSIGRYLIDAGKIAASDMSMQAIADYLRSHPEEQETILHHNPRYVFFKTGDRGVQGCLSVPLTPGRSVALDQGVAPPGALMFIESRKPVCDPKGRPNCQIVKWVDFSRFALNQDTGSAIRGPGRADLFWGSGAYAETAAGHMQHTGRTFFIVIHPEK